jgi:hypothetical protein
MSLPRVVYWNNVPSPYMVERFNAAAGRGKAGLQTHLRATGQRRAPARREADNDNSNG